MTNTEAPHAPHCVITNHVARYRDPVTGLPFYNAAAYKQIRKLQHGDYKWSSLIGAWMGNGGVAAKGVPQGFLGGPRPDKDAGVKTEEPNFEGAAAKGTAKGATEGATEGTPERAVETGGTAVVVSEEGGKKDAIAPDATAVGDATAVVGVTAVVDAAAASDTTATGATVVDATAGQSQGSIPAPPTALHQTVQV